MDVGRRRSGVRNSVAAGSVWESRMKSDEVKGGIKVYSGEESSNKPQIEENNNNNNNNNHKNGDSRRIVKKGQPGNVVGVSGKRKTWKSGSFNGPILQIAAAAAAAKGKNSNLDEQCKHLSVSVDGGIKRISGLNKKGRSEEGNERSSIQTRKTGSEIVKFSSVDSCSNKEMVVHSGEIVIEKNQSVLRKSKSESVKAVDENGNEVDKSSSSSVQLRKVKSELNKDFVNPCDGNDDESDDGNEKFLVENAVIGSEENCKEFDVCEEKMITSDVTNVGLINKSLPEVLTNNDDSVDDSDEEFDEKEEEEVAFEEVEEVEKKEIKSNVPEQKQKQSPEKIVVNEVNKFNQFHDKSAPIYSTVNKEHSPVIRRAAVYSNFSKPTSSSASDDFQSFPETQNKLQTLVDLVMWRDVSKSAFVFGIGTFIIFSSSYTTDLNISFISVISYLGLVYLAAIFLYRAIICRGVVGIDDSSYVVGEDEAIWLLKLILPYLNEFLLKLKALFSGDPSTTMKLAVLLFVLARCGSSITIWKMAKLGFFGVFILPKVCSSYSSQLAGYGKFWVRRFRDAWDSCSQKKAVAVAIFTLVWNLSSMVARIWAVFMLFVAFRYYQHSMMRDDWIEDETAGSEETRHAPQNEGQKETYRPNNDGFVPNRLRSNKLRPTIGQQVKPKKLS